MVVSGARYWSRLPVVVNFCRKGPEFPTRSEEQIRLNTPTKGLAWVFGRSATAGVSGLTGAPRSYETAPPPKDPTEGGGLFLMSKVPL